MSAVSSPAASRLDLGAARAIPFSRLVQVEFRKAYDTRAGRWLLITIAGLVVLAEGVILAILIHTHDDSAAWGDFVGIAAFVTSVLLPVLAILLVTSEWGQRTAMVTFTLEPRRPLVIYAKLVVGVLLTLATVAFAIGVGVVCNAVYALAEGTSDWSFGWNYLFGFVIVQSLAMFGGFALAALLLNTPAAIVAFFAYKYIVPGVLFFLAGELSSFAKVAPWLNFADAQAPLADLSIHGGSQWAHLLVTAAIWLVLPLALGLVRILRAEVK